MSNLFEREITEDEVMEQRAEERVEEKAAKMIQTAYKKGTSKETISDMFDLSLEEVQRLLDIDLED